MTKNESIFKAIENLQEALIIRESAEVPYLIAANKKLTEDLQKETRAAQDYLRILNEIRESLPKMYTSGRTRDGVKAVVARYEDLDAKFLIANERLEQETEAHSLTAAKLRACSEEAEARRTRIAKLEQEIKDIDDNVPCCFLDSHPTLVEAVTALTEAWQKDFKRSNELYQRKVELQQKLDSAMKTIGECWEALPAEYQPPQVEGISKESVQGQVAKLVADFQAQTADIQTAESIVQALETLVVETVDSLTDKNNYLEAVNEDLFNENESLRAELNLARAPKLNYDHGSLLTAGMHYRVVALASPKNPNNPYSVGVSFVASGREDKLSFSTNRGWHNGRTVYNLDGGWYAVVERA